MQCPSCLVRICPVCNADPHDGLACAGFEVEDDLFREWGNHWQRDVKRCLLVVILRLRKIRMLSYEMHRVLEANMLDVHENVPGGGIYGLMPSEMAVWVWK
jgi:hypothetical protein